MVDRVRSLPYKVGPNSKNYGGNQYLYTSSTLPLLGEHDSMVKEWV